MAWDLPLRERYFKQPLETYRGASAGKRSQMQRMLYAAVELRLLLLRLKPDDSNVIDVSDSIERLIPEEKEKAKELRDQALERRARDVEKLTRGELVALESDYRLRGQADQGRQLVETWLALRRKKLDDEDVDGALDLANEYRTLLARPELGAQLLMEVWKRVPGSALLEERLQSLGYRLHEGRWLTQKEFENRPESRFEKAIRSGRVENGMNQDQARRALGVPHRISRIATAKVFTEHWAYDLADGSRMSVRLERKRGQPELVVTGAPPMNGL
ncbi:MAG: hypothetical protein NT069_08315 [Planctomycetota bacterium]|nr:hypothetical protein [Planctomycetota bacterium]